MNQGDLAVDEATDQDLLRPGDGLKDCVDTMALRVCPPTTNDRFASDGLGEARHRSLGRSEDDTMLSDERQRFRCACTLAHDAQGGDLATAAGIEEGA